MTSIARRLLVALALLAVTLMIPTGATAEPATSGRGSGANTSVVTGEAPAPAPETAARAVWTAVSAGGGHTCGIRGPGRLYCWGSDDRGQLGDGFPKDNKDRPVEVAGGFTNWVAVSAGSRHTCAIRTGGLLYCWGDDSNGELGNGGPVHDDVYRLKPVQVARTNWVGVSAGWSMTCARRTSRQLFCWGSNSNGQLGNDDQGVDQSAPVAVQLGPEVRAVTTSGQHSCVLYTAQRNVLCWGGESEGELGDGLPITSQAAPVDVDTDVPAFQAVSAGSNHTCALALGGHLYCWGNEAGLGDGTPHIGENAPSPVEVAGHADDWSTVSAGGMFTCARKTTGRLYCWGIEGNGRLGNGQYDPYDHVPTTIPTEVAGGLTTWTAVDAGDGHACAIKTNGRLFCWGYGAEGALGNGLNYSQWTPVLVG